MKDLDLINKEIEVQFYSCLGGSISYLCECKGVVKQSNYNGTKVALVIIFPPSEKKILDKFIIAESWIIGTENFWWDGKQFRLGMILPTFEQSLNRTDYPEELYTVPCLGETPTE